MHLAAVAVYVASAAYVLLILLPRAGRITDPGAQREILARGFRLQNPVSIGALGVLLMTGAVRLTDVKAQLGPMFFARVGSALTVKLTLAFFLINVATYIAFGLAHRLVRAHQGDVPVDAAWQRSLMRRMRVALCLALALAALTVWRSGAMAPAMASPPPWGPRSFRGATGQGSPVRQPAPWRTVRVAKSAARLP